MDENIEIIERNVKQAQELLRAIMRPADIVVEEYFGGEGSLELACVEALIERLDVILCEVGDAKESYLEYMAEYYGSERS